MKFEEYIHNIRPILDVEEPNEVHIWNGISESLKKQKRIYYYKHALLVVAFIVIAFIASCHIVRVNRKNHLVVLNKESMVNKQSVEISNHNSLLIYFIV